MNPQSGKTFAGSLVDAPGISDLRDGLDLFFDRVIGNLANEAWIMLGYVRIIGVNSK